MSKDRRRLSDDEQALWAEVAKTVTRVSTRATYPESTAVDVPLRPPRQIRVQQAGPTISSAPPADRSNEKRVRRGRLEIGASLDLHGHTQRSGRIALHRFLQTAYQDGERVVIVITGVGRSGQGVLKQRLPQWLTERGDIVSGYAPAHRNHGGAGAFYVFLRRAFTDL